MPRVYSPSYFSRQRSGAIQDRHMRCIQLPNGKIPKSHFLFKKQGGTLSGGLNRCTLSCKDGTTNSNRTTLLTTKNDVNLHYLPNSCQDELSKGEYTRRPQTEFRQDI